MNNRWWAPLAAAVLGACSGDRFYFTDDVDLSFDFVDVPFIRDEDAMHTPYVHGATVVIRANTRNDDRMEGWTLASSDPAVLELEPSLFEADGGDVVVVAHATGGGTADILLVDEDGDERDSFPIDVRAPDRFELAASGPQFVYDDGLAEVVAPKLLAGGLATFEVQWFEGERRLFGNGGLGGVPTDMETTADVQRTYFFENREWIQVRSTLVGEHVVGLWSADLYVADMAFTVVPAAEIASVEMISRGETGLEPDEWTVLLAQSFDAGGEPVFGVEYAWAVDGTAMTGLGDLLRYPFDPDAEAEVVASFDGLEASIVAHVGEEAYVDSSNDVGCDVSGGRASLFGAVLALGAARRRRAP